MCGTNKKDRCGVYPSLYLPLPREPLETPVHHQALQQRVEELKAENAQLQSALASQSEVAEVCTGPTLPSSADACGPKSTRHPHHYDRRAVQSSVWDSEVGSGLASGCIRLASDMRLALGEGLRSNGTLLEHSRLRMREVRSGVCIMVWEVRGDT